MPRDHLGRISDRSQVVRGIPALEEIDVIDELRDRRVAKLDAERAKTGAKTLPQKLAVGHREDRGEKKGGKYRAERRFGEQGSRKTALAVSYRRPLALELS